jgi:hypothetical protein
MNKIRYFVKVRPTKYGLQSVLLFDPFAELEFLNCEGGIEEYEIVSQFNLDRILDLSPGVIEYTSEEITP